MKTRTIVILTLATATCLVHLNVAMAQQKRSLEEIESEEKRLVKEILSGGVGARLVIPGVATSSASPAALTIKSAAEGSWSLSMELPSDQVPMRNMSSVISGNGSIHRFDGEVRYNNDKLPVFIGVGDVDNRLTFLLLKDIGYVYVRGQGKVVFPGGRTVELGNRSQ